MHRWGRGNAFTIGTTLYGSDAPVRPWTDAMAIDRELLAKLACPADRAALELVGDRLRCTKCARRYRIRDTIPVMLLEEADPPA